MMNKTLLAVAILGASVGAQAEGTAEPVPPYAAPFAYAPVAPVTVNEDLVKAYIDYQRKAYAHFVEQQKLARENTPEFLRIPAIPAVPSFGNTSLPGMPGTSAPQFEEAAKRAEAFQRSFTQPMDIEKELSERRNELEAALADAEKRADELAKSL